MDKDQAGKQYEEADNMPIHLSKWIEAPRSGQAEASASEAPLQQQARSVDEVAEQVGAQSYMDAWTSLVMVQELLRENVEKQRVLLAGLEKSRKEMQKLQEEIERDGDLDEEE